MRFFSSSSSSSSSSSASAPNLAANANSTHSSVASSQHSSHAIQESQPTGKTDAAAFPKDSSSAVGSPQEVMSGNNSPASLIASAVRVPVNGLQAFAATIPSSDTLFGATIKSLKEQTGPIKPEKWNTKNLTWRVGADFAAAAAAGICVSPVVSMIDKAIIENASGRAPLMTSIRSSLFSLLTRPHRYLTSKPHLLIFLLYTGTYTSANAIDTLTSTVRDKPASKTSSGTAKFIATSVTNVSLCVYKDSRFTKMFGAAQAAGPKPGVPMISKLLFATRDCLTVFASFNLPPVLAPMLPISEEIEKYATSTSVAQFLAPAGIQLVSTPLHLLGLDMYNRPRGEGVTTLSRAAKVWKDWGTSCLARMARIVPAFGFGGVVNTKVRASMMNQLE